MASNETRRVSNWRWPGCRDTKTAAHANHVVATQSKLITALSASQPGELIYVIDEEKIDPTGQHEPAYDLQGQMTRAFV